MNPQGADHRPKTANTSIFRVCTSFSILLLLIVTILWHPARAQQPNTVPVANPASLTAEQVVYNLTQMNVNRAQALHAYQGTRTYRVEYQGFPGSRTAEIVVKMKYVSPGKKAFVIQSTMGSTLIIDKVLKKLLEAEKQESSPRIAQSSALTDTNYKFTLVEHGNGSSGATYVLEVDPRRSDKFLYHGRIWVDAADFAVVRVEAAPAKSVSFWTKNADIVQVYKKVHDFWLPAYNHSVTAIRLGGHADLTIEYKDYEITDASRVSSLPARGSILHTGADHTQQ